METKICEKCQSPKPISNFEGKGQNIRLDGTIIKYRSSICRKCQRTQRLENGKCPTCNRELAPNRRSCEYCLQIMNESIKRRNHRDRLAAFKYYGNSCKYCQQSIQIFLTIDHTNNNGAEHRRQQRSGDNQGHNIYAWLRKNNYPEGFQTLCYNCNCAKHIYGEADVLEALRSAQNLPLPPHARSISGETKFSHLKYVLG